MRISIIPPLILFALGISILSALIYMPSTTSYSPWNNDNSGLGLLLEELHAKPVANLDSSLCNQTIILVLNGKITEDEANNISSLVNCGSRIVIGDSHGYSSPVLKDLGVNVVYSNYQVLDEISKYDYRWLIKTNTTGYVSEQIIIPNITYIELDTKPNFLYSKTSPFAYVDVDGNGIYSTPDKMGSYPVLAGWKIGNGSIVLIPSNLFFTNKYLNLSSNARLILSLSKGSNLYVYLNTLALAPVDSVKFYVYQWMNKIPSGISWIIGIISATGLTYIWTIQYIDSKRTRKDKLVFILIFSSIPFIVTAMESSQTIYIAPIIVLIPILLFNSNAFISLAIAMSLVATMFSPLYIFLYLVILLITSSITRQSYGQSFLGSSSISLLILQLINSLLVFIHLPMIIGITTASLFILTIAMGSYVAFLRQVTVESIDLPKEGYINVPINLTFAVRSRAPVKWIGRNEDVEIEKLVENNDIININYIPKHSGLNRISFNLAVTDLWGFSWRDMGSRTFEINILPQVFKMLARAEALLSGQGAGELLARISMTVLMRSEELTGAISEISGKELARIAWESVDGEGKIHELIRQVIQEYLEGVGGMKSRRGEYIGVREYVPSDSPRNIHWKKSLSIQRLVSKEFVLPNEEEVGGSSGRGGNIIYIINLDCTKNIELDALLTRMLNILITSSIRDSEMPFNIVLVSGKSIIILKGPVLGVLNLLYNTLKKNPLKLKYNYDSINRHLDPLEIKFLTEKSNIGLINALAASLTNSSKTVVKALLKEDLKPPMQFTVLHCKAMSSWASFLVYSLVNAGYKYETGAVAA